MSESSANAPLTLTRLTVPQMIALLKASGSQHVTEDALKAHLAAGAPANPDGTINLVHFAAWLVRESENARH